MPVVFCKPDALIGLHSVVASERASAMLLALAAYCRDGGWDGIPSEWTPSAERAALQVAERAVTEPTFRGRIANAPAVASRLEAAASTMPVTSAPTRDVLLLSLNGLGFTVGATAQIVLGESGVDSVYRHGVTTADFMVVRPRLVEYLAHSPIDVWSLTATQAECALQWWKTYARQILLDREPGKHLLRNLVHVCEGPDAAYLEDRLCA